MDYNFSDLKKIRNPTASKDQHNLIRSGQVKENQVRSKLEGIFGATSKSITPEKRDSITPGMIRTSIELAKGEDANKPSSTKLETLNESKPLRSKKLNTSEFSNSYDSIPVEISTYKHQNSPQKQTGDVSTFKPTATAAKKTVSTTSNIGPIPPPPPPGPAPTLSSSVYNPSSSKPTNKTNTQQKPTISVAAGNSLASSSKIPITSSPILPPAKGFFENTPAKSSPPNSKGKGHIYDDAENYLECETNLTSIKISSGSDAYTM